MSITDDKAYAIEQRLNALMGRVGLVDAGGFNPEVVSGAGLVQIISGSRLGQANTATVVTTGANSLGSVTIPGGDVETGTTYEIFAAGTFTTGGTPPTSATFTVFWGAGGIGSATPPTVPASITTGGWFVRAEITWLSATETFVVIQLGWRTGPGIGNSVTYFTTTDTTGLSSTGSNALALTFGWGSTPGSQSLSCNVIRYSRKA